jgi:integrase
MHALSRLQLAERILATSYLNRQGSVPLFVRECMTLEGLEHLQERLLAGDEGRYDTRSPNTVNSTMGAVMAFVRFCHRHGWIDRVPPVEKLDVDDVMKGRPITTEEFERMLEAVPKVVGEDLAASWALVLRILWESGFRIGDVMDFAWEDARHIHPVWPTRPGDHPTLMIPSTQKNGQTQVIPMLPGLQRLLEATPPSARCGWVVNPQPLRGESAGRLTKDRVSRMIARIGQEAGIVVRVPDERRGHRVKYASAHDVRRGCAVRLFNAGVSAETLMVVMRHADFATTQKFYGAMRSAQSAAAEVREKLTAADKRPTESSSIAGGFLGGSEPMVGFSEAETAKLRALLASL